MYTRLPHTPRWNGNDGRREPSYRRGGLPLNYSGTAFHINPTTGEASVAEVFPRRPEDDTTPRFNDLPRVSNLPAARPIAEEHMSDREVTVEVPEAPRPNGLLSLLDNRHFPFGHGIGYEEMLLIGLIFFLAKEGDGEGDLNETLILLGLLLLGG